MRNLKRALSLALASVMLLGMMGGDHFRGTQPGADPGGLCRHGHPGGGIPTLRRFNEVLLCNILYQYLLKTRRAFFLKFRVCFQDEASTLTHLRLV